MHIDRVLERIVQDTLQPVRQIYGELPRTSTRILLLDGEGRALCAGGDVAEVREGL